MRRATKRGGRAAGISQAAAVLAAAWCGWSGGAVPDLKISIAVRETGTAAAIGADGGTANGIEFIKLDGQSVPLDSQWHQVSFTFGTDPVTAFAGGTANGVLDGVRGTLEQIRILNSSKLGASDPIKLYIDDVKLTINNAGGSSDATGEYLLANGFEGFAENTVVMFQYPSFSGSTQSFVTAGSTSRTRTEFAHSGTQSQELAWTYTAANDTYWIRDTTFASGNQNPNPTINFAAGNTLSFWMLGFVGTPSNYWKTNGNGDWGDAANWTIKVPGAVGDVANFLDVGVTAPAVTVNVTGAVLINGISFKNATTSYTLAAGGGLLALTGPNNQYEPVIAASLGSHTVNVPIQLGLTSHLNAAGAGDTLTVAGDVTVAEPPLDPNVILYTDGAGTVNLGAAGLTPSVVSVPFLTVNAGTTNVRSGVTLTVNGQDTTTPSDVNFRVGAGAVLNLATNLDTTAGGTVPGAAVNQGTINLAAGKSLTVGNMIAGAGAGTVNVAAGATFNGKQLRGALHAEGTVNVAAGSGPSLVTTLDVGAAGKVDVGDNDMIVDWTGTDPTSDVIADIVAAYAKGRWNGAHGITSSAAAVAGGVTGIGYATQAQLPGTPPTFDSLPIDGTTLVLKYTYVGDTDLDGDVDAADFARMVAGPGTWASGDNNYDGVVSSDDFARATLAFALQGAPLSAAVPEPAAAGLLGLAGAALVGRRRRV